MRDVRVITLLRVEVKKPSKMLHEYDMAVARGDPEYTNYRSQKFMWLT